MLIKISIMPLLPSLKRSIAIDLEKFLGPLKIIYNDYEECAVIASGDINDTAFADFIEIHVYDLYLKYKIHSLVVSYGEEFKSYGSNVYPALKKILDKGKQEKIKLASDEISLLDRFAFVYLLISFLFQFFTNI